MILRLSRKNGSELLFWFKIPLKNDHASQMLLCISLSPSYSRINFNYLSLYFLSIESFFSREIFLTAQSSQYIKEKLKFLTSWFILFITKLQRNYKYEFIIGQLHFFLKSCKSNLCFFVASFDINV